jgi:diacylglycerol O-acyltransferase
VRRLDDDGVFFYLLESEEQPFPGIWVARLGSGDRTKGSSPIWTLPMLRERVEQKLRILPSWHWRVYPVPFGLQTPVLADDPDIDLDYHVRRVVLGAEPGAPTNLDALVARLAEQRLDRRHPLWRMLLVDGSEDGSQYLIVLMHHALWDGIAGDAVLTCFLSNTAEAVEPEPTLVRRVGRLQLISDALRDHLRSWPRLPGVVWSTVRGSRAIHARRRLAEVPVPRPFVDTPVCSLNNSLGVERSSGRVVLSVSDIRRVKNAAGVTFSHVVLALVATALRSALLAEGDLPERPLTANVPVSSELPDAPSRQWGNRFGNMITSLATDIEDPWERLLRIAAVAREARVQLELLGVGTPSRWAEFAWPIIARPIVRHMARAKREHPEKSECSVLVSNIPSGSECLAEGRGAADALWVYGPPLDGVAAVVAVYGVKDHLTMSVVTHAQALANGPALAAAFRSALSELISLVDSRSPQDAPSP